MKTLCCQYVSEAPDINMVIGDALGKIQYVLINKDEYIINKKSD